MRHLLLKSFVLKTNLWKDFARSVASAPAVNCSDGVDKNGTLGQRWQQHENQVLIAGVEKQQLELEKVGRWNADQSSKQKWEQIEYFCHSKGINRNAEQCRQRWQRLLHAFFKVKSWENCIPHGKRSFWLMRASERKEEGLPFNLDWKIFNAINDIQSRKELWYSSAGFSSSERVSTESPSANMSSLEPETDDSEVSQQCIDIEQQSEMDNFERRPCTGVEHQLETDSSQQCAEEAAISIGSNLDMHGLEDKSSAQLSGWSAQANNSQKDDRPPLLVHFLNQCLVDLKGLDYNSCDSGKAQDDEDQGINNGSSVPK